LYLDVQDVNAVEWFHIVSIVTNLNFYKLLLIIIVAIVYPWVYLRNRFVNAESTKWINVMLLTEKIIYKVGKILIIAILFGSTIWLTYLVVTQ
jgi:hypothetical protein